MRLTSRMAALGAATALSTLLAMSASADVISNDLDTVVDGVHEQMNLTLPGDPGHTKLYVIVDGVPGNANVKDHPKCNITGSHTITLVATVADPTIATVSLSGEGVLRSCADTVTATVTPKKVGFTAVTFSGIEQTSNDPHLVISYAEADFDVNVTQGTTDDNGGSRCDNDRAAPAWARAFLKANDLKAKVAGKANYVSTVARHMGPGATFNSIGKAAHPDYENAVYQYMTTTLGLSLSKGPDDVRKPGERCTPLPTS